MILSMTAYGRAKKNFPTFDLSVEIHSVNRKHFDLSIRLPRELMCYDPLIRKIIGKQVARGHITVTVSLMLHKESLSTVSVDHVLLTKMVEATQPLFQESFDKNRATLLLTLLQKNDVWAFQTDFEKVQTVENALQEVTEIALVQFMKMKEQEGKVIKNDFSDRLILLKKYLQHIEQETANIQREARIKIEAKIQDISTNTQIQQELIKEVALELMKMDVTEEIVRFQHHIASIEKLFESKAKEPCGKMLEFTFQEMLREINTLGSKIQSITLTKYIIECKSEIEKLKEQVQNVE